MKNLGRLRLGLVLLFSIGIFLIFLSPSIPRKERDSIFSKFLKTRIKPADHPKTNRPEFLRVPILLYHYIEDNQDERDFLRTSMATRPSFFERQMRYLATSGYEAIPLSDLKRGLDGEIMIPKRSILLTFDDGFRDYYDNAFPVLKKYNLRATVYMIANHIGRSGNLTVGMLREMIDSGVFELGSHTLNHVWLSQVSLEEARREIFQSKLDLEETFGLKIKHFSYPGGFESPEIVSLVREAGYETAATTDSGIIQSVDRILTLKRLRVGNIDEATFAARLEGVNVKEKE